MPSFDEEFQKAYSYHQSAKFSLAESIYNDLLKIQPNNKDLILLLGTLYLQSKDLIKSENFFKKYLAIDNSNYLAFQNLGVLSNAKGDYKQARNFLEKSIFLNPKNYHAQFYLSKSLFELDQFDDAYKTLKSYLKNIDDNSEAFFDMGNICFSINKIDESIFYYDKSLELKSDYHESIANKALALSKIPNYEDALNYYDKAISIHDCELYRMNYGNLLRHLGLHKKSIEQFLKILNLNRNNKEAFFFLQNTYQSANLFDDLDLINLKKIIRNNKDGFDPFSLLYLFDDLELQLINARKYTLKRFNNINEKKISNLIVQQKKIKIVYVSADLREHPVARLIHGVIKDHDRKTFEVYGLSLKKTDDDIQKKLSKEFDIFFDASSCSNNEILNYCHEKKFDIAIDLGGFTRFAKTNLFACRLAPIQISFLGFLGTMGANFIDFIIADKKIIPEKLKEFYTESILYLPSFQPFNDGSINQIKKIFKKELKLPKDKFIFCCFNNAFKISKLIVDSWIRILNKAPNSILVCYVKNDFQKENLSKYFIANKIKKNRLIFTEKASYDIYFSKLKLCDLFLDTYPYNGGATMQDALRASLPMLTLVGDSFVSRMGLSILSSVGLADMCAYSIDEYENKAIFYSKNQDRLFEIRNKLDIFNNTQKKNIKSYTKYYEEGLRKISNNFLKNSPKKDVYID